MLGINAHAHESVLIAEAHKPFSENRMAEAIEMYKIAISNHHPEKECKIRGLGSIKHQQGYYQHNISQWYFQEAVPTADNNPYDPLSLCYSITRDYEAATQYYLNMMNQYPDNCCLKFGLANVYNNQGKVIEATALYETILIQTKCNQGQCLRELLLLSFAGQDFDSCRDYLAQIKSFPQEVQVETIEAFLISDPIQRIAKTQQLINKNPYYTRLHMLLAYIYQRDCQDIQKAIDIYQQCIDQGVKNRQYRQDAYFSLSKLYRKALKYDQSTSVIKRLLEGIGDNWLAYLFIAQDQLKLGKGHQSLHYLKNCQSEIQKNDRIYLSEQNRIFLMKQIKEDIRDMQKYLIYNKLAQQINLTDSLHSIFQGDININTTKIRMNNTNLLNFLRDISEQPRQPTILQHIYHLFCQHQTNLQLLDLYSSKLIVEAIQTHPMSLQTVSEELMSILSIKIAQQKTEVFSEIDPSHGKYEYKLKVSKNKIVDAFASKEISTYFSKYSHLYMVIKKISLKVKDIKPWLELLVEKVKLNPKLLVFNQHISLKVDGKNEWICINQIIQELLPETYEQNQHLLKEVERSFATSYHKTLPELTKILIKKWQDVVTRVLDHRRAERKEIRCEITDWAIVQLIFPSQMRLIQSLEDIKQWCEQSGTVIVGVQGHLDRDKELRLKVVIKQICCMIKLKVNYKLKLKQFQQALGAVIGNNRNVIFNTLLNLNKHHQYSLLSQIKEMSQYFDHTRTPEGQKIKRFVANFANGIECIDNWQQFSRHEKLKLSESWISPSKMKRHEQRLLTQTQDRFPSDNQIRTEVSVQTEQLKPHEIMQKYQPINTLFRTTSQNNINFIDQADKQDRNMHNIISKRSMFLHPSQSDNFYESEQPNGKPSFEELPQKNKSRKCLQKFDIKYSHSETESEHEQQVREVSKHKEPVEVINQERSRENQQLKGHIQALFKHNQELATNFSLKLSEKEAEIAQLSKELQDKVHRQRELLSCIDDMKNNHQKETVEKDDRINKLQDSVIQKDKRLMQMDEMVKVYNEKSKKQVNNNQKLVIALRQELVEAHSALDRSQSDYQQIKNQLDERDRQIFGLINNRPEKSHEEAAKVVNCELLQTKLNDLHIENLHFQVKLRQAIHEKELRVSDITKQMQVTKSKFANFIVAEKRLRQEIQNLKAENAQLRSKLEQISSSLHEIQIKEDESVAEKEKQERQTNCLREMVGKMKSEIACLKKQLERQSRQEKCACWDRRASNKRRQYLVILFTILLFQAITISFTLNLIK